MRNIIQNVESFDKCLFRVVTTFTFVISLIINTVSCLSKQLWRDVSNNCAATSVNVPSGMGIRTDLSESSLGAFWIDRDAKFLHAANNEDSDHTWQIHRMI